MISIDKIKRLQTSFFSIVIMILDVFIMYSYSKFLWFDEMLIENDCFMYLCFHQSFYWFQLKTGRTYEISSICLYDHAWHIIFICTYSIKGLKYDPAFFPSNWYCPPLKKWTQIPFLLLLVSYLLLLYLRWQNLKITDWIHKIIDF